MEIVNTAEKANEEIEQKVRDGASRFWVDLYMPNLPGNTNGSTSFVFYVDDGIWKKDVPFSFQEAKRVSKFLDSPKAGTRFLVEIEILDMIVEPRKLKLRYFDKEMETFIEAESTGDLHRFLQRN